jgi:carbon storage regulator
MLVLARKIHQKIVIGDNIVIQVLRKSRDVVKLGIQAPTSVPVHRQEVYDEIQRSNQEAVHQGPHELPAFTHKLKPSSPVQAHGMPSGPVPIH